MCAQRLHIHTWGREQGAGAGGEVLRTSLLVLAVELHELESHIPHSSRRRLGGSAPSLLCRRRLATLEGVCEVAEEPRPAEAATTDHDAIAAGFPHHP